VYQNEEHFATGPTDSSRLSSVSRHHARRGRLYSVHVYALENRVGHVSYRMVEEQDGGLHDSVFAPHCMAKTVRQKSDI
jgi:hypothetical protein